MCWLLERSEQRKCVVEGGGGMLQLLCKGVKVRTRPDQTRNKLLHYNNDQLLISP